MSKLGTVFSVINLGLAAVFLGSAASLIGTSGEYRRKLEEAESAATKSSEEKDKAIADLQARYAEADGQATRARQENERLKGENAARNEELEAEKLKTAELTASLNGINAKLGDLEQTNRNAANRVSELSRQMEQLRTERDQAMDERDTAVARATQAGEAQQTAEKKLSDKNAQVARLTDEVESARARLMQASKAFGFNPTEVAAQPLDLEGVVLTASYSEGVPIIVINRGRKDRIQPGYVFDVYGGNHYKGQIRVSSVNESNASATVVLPGTAQIAPGDRFKSQL